MYFWAKTTEDGKPGISVYEHMINVGCVARCIADAAPGLLKRFELPSSLVGALAALHDLGKVSPGFQRKCQVWLEENGLEKIDRNACWDTSMESEHGKVSHAAIQSFLLNTNFDRRTAKYLSTVLGAHHGRLSSPTERVYRPNGAISDTFSKIDWDGERNSAAQEIWDFFGINDSSLAITADSPSLWWLHGISEEMLVGQPEPPEVWQSFCELVGAAPLVAHNAPFDSSFVRCELSRLGLGFTNPWHCTVRLARRKLPHLPNHRLDTVYRYLFGSIPHYTTRHRALDDARLTSRVWEKLRHI